MNPLFLLYLGALICSTNYVLGQDIIVQQPVDQPVQQVQPAQQNNGPNYQITGTFVLERAQTVAMPVFALLPNGSEPMTFDPSISQQPEIGTNDQPPITLVIPQTPSLVYPEDSQSQPEDSQSSQSAPLGSSNGGQPPITQQIPQTQSLVYPNQPMLPIMTLPAALPPTGLTANAANQPPITKQIPSTPSLIYPAPQSAPGPSPVPQVIFLQPLPGGPNQYYPTFPRITSLPQMGGPPSQPQITQRIPQIPSLVYPTTAQLSPPGPTSMASAPPPSMPCRPVPTAGPQLPLPCQMLMRTIAAQSQLGALPPRQQSSPFTSVSCPFSNLQMSSSVPQPTGFVAMPFPPSFPLSYTQPPPAVIDPLGPLGSEGFGEVSPERLFASSPSGSSPSTSNQIQAFRNYFLQLAQGVANSTPSSQTTGSMRRR